MVSSDDAGLQSTTDEKVDKTAMLVFGTVYSQEILRLQSTIHFSQMGHASP